MSPLLASACCPVLVAGSDRPGLLADAVIKYRREATWGGVSAFQLIAYTPSPREAKVVTQGRNLETGTEAEAMEWCCSLACFRLLLRNLSYISRNYLPSDGSSHSEMGLPTSISNQEISLQTWPKANLKRVLLHLRHFSSQVTLGGLKLTAQANS